MTPKRQFVEPRLQEQAGLATLTQGLVSGNGSTPPSGNFCEEHPIICRILGR